MLWTFLGVAFTFVSASANSFDEEEYLSDGTFISDFNGVLHVCLLSAQPALSNRDTRMCTTHNIYSGRIGFLLPCFQKSLRTITSHAAQYMVYGFYHERQTFANVCKQSNRQANAHACCNRHNSAFPYRKMVLYCCLLSDYVVCGLKHTYITLLSLCLDFLQRAPSF